MTTLDQEHLVLLSFVPDKLSWTANERMGIGEPGIPNPSRRHAVERMIREHLEKSGTGYCDGGGGGIDGRSEIFLYGPDGEKLWQDIEPLVKLLLEGTDARVYVRLGSVEDASATSYELEL